MRIVFLHLCLIVPRRYCTGRPAAYLEELFIMYCVLLRSYCGTVLSWYRTMKTETETSTETETETSTETEDE